MAEVEAQPFLVHNVFFTLADNSAAAKARLMAACANYLTGHPGAVFYGAGPLAEELIRPVNDRNFDVALTIIFDSPAAHDAYQVHPQHLRFIEENKVNWKQVRVFDSKVRK